MQSRVRFLAYEKPEEGKKGGNTSKGKGPGKWSRFIWIFTDPAGNGRTFCKKKRRTGSKRGKYHLRLVEMGGKDRKNNSLGTGCKSAEVPRFRWVWVEKLMLDSKWDGQKVEVNPKGAAAGGEGGKREYVEAVKLWSPKGRS